MCKKYFFVSLACVAKRARGSNKEGVLVCVVVYICQESSPRNLSRATRLSFYSKMKCTHDFQESQNEVLKVHFANVHTIYLSVGDVYVT